MTVESATYINQLVATNPGSSDLKSEGDDHLRLIKGVLQSTFPAVVGAVSATDTELSYVHGVTSAIQTQLAAKVSTGAVGTLISVSKPATSTITSSTALASDADLTCTLAAGTYSVDLYLPLWATTNGIGGFKWALSFGGTATSSSFGYYYWINNSGGLNQGAVTAGTTVSYSQIDTGAPGPDFTRITGTITVTVSGTLAFQWAQFASSTNATNLGKGAWMTCTKVA